MKKNEECVVLVVDDQETSRHLVAVQLNNAFPKLFMAASGNEAIAIMQTQTVDVILSDVNMPNGDGLDLLAWVRRHRPGVFVFFMSADPIFDAKGKEVNQDQRFSPDGLFPKPVDPKLLLDALHAACFIRETDHRCDKGV